MARALASLTIDQLVVHEVPKAMKHDPNPEPLRLSDVPVRLNGDQRRYLQERLRSSLGEDARSVIEAQDHGSPVPGWVRELLVASDAEYVRLSRDMAAHLRTVQTGNSPDGLFLVARCTWAGAQAVLLAKVELEQGVRAQQTTLPGGKVTYDMELITDLIFGETSRVYKVGLFSAHDVQADEPITGFAIDRQKGGPQVTRFFLYDYLGCDYAADSAENTRRFYEASRDFINNTVRDPGLKAQYVVALAAEVASPKSEISPTLFASNHLHPEHRDKYLNAITATNVPREPFRKSPEYVATNTVRFQTERNIVVVADAEHARDPEIIEVRDHAITIHDPVVNVTTQGRRGSPRPETYIGQ